MKIRHRTADDHELALGSAIEQVKATTGQLQRTRMASSRLTHVRRDFAAAEAAVDGAIRIAFDGGATDAPVLRWLRDRRELLLMAELSTSGLDVPDCAQPASLGADGPATAGLDFEREASVPGHAHGLDLEAALDPRTRAVAGAPGPHLPPRRAPHRHPEEPGTPCDSAQYHPTKPRTIVYGDFSSLRSYLASILTDTLVGTDAAVEWRAVQHHPRLPFPGLRLDEAAQQCLAAEWLECRPLLSEDLTVRYRPRTFIPNTQATVAAFAEANDAGVGDEVRQLLFNAYWANGDDIGDPEVLRRLVAAPLRRGTSTARPVAQSGYAVTLAHGPVTSGAYRRIQAWNQDWHEAGVRDASEVILIDKAGQVFAGPKALLELVSAGRAASASKLSPAL
jgi:2-hydroxychromene-2-carboxylate isomerase